MRQQTPEERFANPTTFGYARFPLTDDEREWLAYDIELLESMIRRLQDGNNGRINPGELPTHPPLPPGFEYKGWRR
jgi:hypothetical protein